jgi:hypothetical protein
MDDLKDRIVKKACEVRDTSRSSMKPYANLSEEALTKVLKDENFIKARLEESSSLWELFALLDELDAIEGRPIG